MYLTTKKINGQYYLYVRKCTRKNSAKAPMTKTIKCLGNAKKYSKEDIEFIKKLLKEKTTNVLEFIEDLRKDNESKRIKRNNKEKKNKCVICGFDIVTVLHHRIPVFKGGTHDEENLVCLCPNHHQMVHKGLLSDEEIEESINKVRRNKNKCKG